MKFHLINFIFISLSFTFLAQDNDDELIQFSGVLVSRDSLDMVSYASVINKTTGTGTVADYYGYFSLVARASDTLIFNAFGFKTSSYMIPDSLVEERYSIVHIMTPDTILLPEVKVYPWPSREQFAKAFVEMQPYDDAFRKAQRNLSGESLAIAASRLQADPTSSYNWARQQQETKIYTQGIVPVNNLFNPVSWASFVRAWRNGDFQRQK